MYNGKKIAATALAAIMISSLLPGVAFADPKGGSHDSRPGANRGRTDNTWNNGHNKKDKHNKKHDKKHDKPGNRGRTDNTWNKGHDKSSTALRDSNRSAALRRSEALRRSQEEAARRQKTKNDWRNLAIAAGGVAAYGLIRKDPTIAFIGAAGALYSLNRYEQDRKSQSAASRTRAAIFAQPYFTRDGRRYERRIVTKNGQRYYQFVRK